MLSIDLDAEPTVEAQNTPTSGTWKVGFQEPMSSKVIRMGPCYEPSRS